MYHYVSLCIIIYHYIYHYIEIYPFLVPCIEKNQNLASLEGLNCFPQQPASHRASQGRGRSRRVVYCALRGGVFGVVHKIVTIFHSTSLWLEYVQ
jgi:hypothetical protein